MSFKFSDWKISTKLLAAFMLISTIHAAQDEKLRGIMEEVDGYHNAKFQPAIKAIYDISAEVFEQGIVRENATAEMDQLFDQVILEAEGLEEDIKAHIEESLVGFADEQSILANESTWADATMEMKSTIAFMRIALARYAQCLDDQERVNVEREYNTKAKEFDGWMHALLDGGVTAQGRIARVSLPGLRIKVEKLARSHARLQQVSATAQPMSQGATEQAAGVEQTTASVEQMNASVQQNTENARVTNDISTCAADEAGRLLETMVPNISKTADLVEEITAASGEQSSGIAQINDSMGQLDTTTQQSAAASEELAATAEELSAQATQLQQAVAFFRLETSVH